MPIRCPDLINCFTNWHWSAVNSVAYAVGLGYPLDDPEAPNSLVAIDPRDVHRGPNNVTLCNDLYQRTSIYETVRVTATDTDRSCLTVTDLHFGPGATRGHVSF